MRTKFKWIFTLLLAFSMQFSFAQEKTVTGVVSDKTGPLPGANVVVKGTTKSTQADFDGKFSISAKAGEVLVISFTGYNNSTVTVGAANSYRVTLSEGIALQEVVVLGYDKTSSKPKSVSAVTTISSETIKNRPNVTVLQSLVGNAPGLNVFSSSGSPGTAKYDLLIRGAGSVNSSTEPLYIIDGIPANSVVFRNINPEDIESVSVLKDAAATSIYGSRSSNGVVVITTKSGKFDSKFRVSYSSTYGISELPKDDYNIMNSTQLLTLQRERGTSAGFGQNVLLNKDLGRDPLNFTPLTDEEIARAPSTDWRKVFFNTSVTKSHNLSFTSGGKNLNNFTSVSYTNQEGIVKNTDFQRFTFRSNFNGKTDNERFQFGTFTTMSFSTRNQLGQETNAAVNNNVIQNPLQGSLTGVPYYGLGDGFYPGTGQGLFDNIGTDFNNGNTILALQDLLVRGNQPNRYNDLKILTNANASFDLTKHLTVSTKLGVDYTVSDRVFARAPWSFLAIAVRETTPANAAGAAVPLGGFEDRVTTRDFGFNNVTSLVYNNQFGKHSLTAGLYTEYLKSHYTSNFSRHIGLDLLDYAFGAGTGWTNLGVEFPSLIPVVSAFKADAGTFAYFGSATYDYDDRFGLDVVVRRDASYRFVDDNKWGTFGSVGGRWNIDKQSFMKNSVFNMLKLRASYGIQGNQNLGVPAFGGTPIYTQNNLVRDLVASGTGYGNTAGYDLAQFGNNLLQWEEQIQMNFGLDFGLWNDKLSGTVDVYNKKTDQLLSTIPLSAAPGATTGVDGNNGSLQNRGIELMLKYKLIRNENVNLTVFANGSYNKNKYLAFQEEKGGLIINAVGTQVNEYYMVPYAGINNVGYTDVNGVAQPANGNLLFLDINNNLTENPSNELDPRRTGKSNIPVYQGGFGFNFDYKGFSLDAQFTYVYDVWRLDYSQLWLMSPSFLTDNNMSADILDAWTPTNTDTDIPSLDASNFDLASELSDKWLKDASYVRLRNLNFGYSFDKKMLEKTFMTSLKFFVQAENLYTWTKWRGFDADSGELTNLGKFPAPKTVSFGVNVEF